MRNETCPICGQPTVQAQVVVAEGRQPISTWLCELHAAAYWIMPKRGLPTLDQIKEYAGGMRPPENKSE